MGTRIVENNIKKRVFNMLNKMKGKEVYNFKFDDSFLKNVDVFLKENNEEKNNFAQEKDISNNINLENKEEINNAESN